MLFETHARTYTHTHTHHTVTKSGWACLMAAFTRCQAVRRNNTRRDTSESQVWFLTLSATVSFLYEIQKLGWIWVGWLYLYRHIHTHEQGANPTYPGICDFKLPEDVLRHVVLSHWIHHKVLVPGWTLRWPVLMTLLLQETRREKKKNMSTFVWIISFFKNTLREKNKQWLSHNDCRANCCRILCDISHWEPRDALCLQMEIHTD